MFDNITYILCFKGTDERVRMVTDNKKLRELNIYGYTRTKVMGYENSNFFVDTDNITLCLNYFDEIPRVHCVYTDLFANKDKYIKVCDHEITDQFISSGRIICCSFDCFCEYERNPHILCDECGVEKMSMFTNNTSRKTGKGPLCRKCSVKTKPFYRNYLNLNHIYKIGDVYCATVLEIASGEAKMQFKIDSKSIEKLDYTSVITSDPLIPKYIEELVPFIGKRFILGRTDPQSIKNIFENGDRKIGNIGVILNMHGDPVELEKRVLKSNIPGLTHLSNVTANNDYFTVDQFSVIVEMDYSIGLQIYNNDKNFSIYGFDCYKNHCKLPAGHVSCFIPVNLKTDFHLIQPTEIKHYSDGLSGDGLNNIISNHEIKYLTFLGSGSFGNVKLAEYNGRKVAVKTLKREGPSLSDEINIMAELGNHTNIVSMIGYDTERTKIIMELCNDDSLFGLLEAEQIAIATKIRWLLEISLGMTHIHSKNIIHGDLSISNILLKDGVIKVADFGLSFVEGNRVNDITNRVCQLCPGSKNFDKKTDVWSFGIIIWDVLSQYKGGTFRDKYISKNRYNLIESLSEEFGEMKPLLSCLHNVPEKRPHFHDINKYLSAQI